MVDKQAGVVLFGEAFVCKLPLVVKIAFFFFLQLVEVGWFFFNLVCRSCTHGSVALSVI